MEESTSVRKNTSDQALSDAYSACLNHAQNQSQVMAKRWYTLLAEKLLDKSTTSMNVPEKREIHLAWVALATQQAAIEQGFPVAFAQVVA
jgi:hypothetical protein